MVTQSTYGALPGRTADAVTVEQEVYWGREGHNLYLDNLIIDSTTTDPGSTPTSELRQGLLMAQQTADSNLNLFNVDASDGTELMHDVLLVSESMLDVDGVAEDKYGHLLVRGGVKAADLLIEGSAFVGHAAEHLARRQMQTAGRYWFDDEIQSLHAYLGLWATEIAKTADYTVTEDDVGKLLTNTGATGAVTFTLPSVKAGLAYEFLVVADQDVTVASADGDDIVIFNDVSADSVAFSTAGEKIGGRVVVEGNAAGTKWYVRNHSPDNTITVAT